MVLRDQLYPDGGRSALCEYSWYSSSSSSSSSSNVAVVVFETPWRQSRSEFCLMFVPVCCQLLHPTQDWIFHQDNYITILHEIIAPSWWSSTRGERKLTLIHCIVLHCIVLYCLAVNRRSNGAANRRTAHGECQPLRHNDVHYNSLYTVHITIYKHISYKWHCL